MVSRLTAQKKKREKKLVKKTDCQSPRKPSRRRHIHLYVVLHSNLILQYVSALYKISHWHVLLLLLYLFNYFNNTFTYQPYSWEVFTLNELLLDNKLYLLFDTDK